MSTADGAATMIEAQDDEPEAAIAVSAVALVLLVVVAISYAAIRYLNWAMAPRRFWTRVVFAGALPAGILIGLLVALDLSRGVNVATAFANLSRIPVGGRLMVAGMLVTGTGVAWLTAGRRDRGEAYRIEREVNMFQ